MSRDLQANCIISLYFHLYLMFHACAVKFVVTRNLKKFFDVTGNFKKFLIFG